MNYNKSVRFDNVQVFDTWGLLLEKFTISPPEPELITIDVPGRDGVIDITENLFGTVPYKNRTINITLTMPDKDTWAETYTNLLTDIHGKTKQIVFDADPGYYYTGRCRVANHDREGRKAVTFEIEVDADPYKYLISDPTQKTL